MENYNNLIQPGDIIASKDDRRYIKLTPYLYDCCIEYLKRRKCSEKTKILYTHELKKIFNNKELTQAIYNKVHSRGNYYKSVLKVITKSCEHFDIEGYSYKIITPIKRPRHNPQTWSEFDIKKMASNIEEYGLLIDCAYYIGAGLRFSSAIMLSWEDFAWDNWIDNKDKVGKCYVHGKGDKEGILMVDPILMNRLYNIANDRGKIFLGIPYKNSAENLYLFINKSELDEFEDKFKKQNFDNVLDSNNEEVNIKERAKIEMIRKKHYLVDYKLGKLSRLFNGKKVKFHSIRSSRATNLLKKGVKLITIKEQLMHNSIATTEIYLNLENSDIENEFNDKL